VVLFWLDECLQGNHLSIKDMDGIREAWRKCEIRQLYFFFNVFAASFHEVDQLILLPAESPKRAPRQAAFFLQYI
jgi:hypothetical protein